MDTRNLWDIYHIIMNREEDVARLDFKNNFGVSYAGYVQNWVQHDEAKLNLFKEIEAAIIGGNTYRSMQQHIGAAQHLEHIVDDEVGRYLWCDWCRLRSSHINGFGIPTYH